MIKQIAHICIRTQDLEGTLKFYTEVLGLEKGFEFEKEGSTFGYYIKFGNNTFVEVFKGDPGEAGNINHVAVEAEDLDGLIERLKSKGVAVGEKKWGADQSWQVWVTDPNGVRIEFQEYTANSSQVVGGKCMVNW